MSLRHSTFAVGMMVIGVVVNGCSVLPSGRTNLDDFAAALNARQVTSCVRLMGSYGPLLGVSAVIATGGATLEECQTVR